MATKIINGQVVELTQAEIDARAAEEAAWQSEYNAKAWQRNRIAAYEAKGWYTWDDYMDDILKRGQATVEADRQAIKDLYPKPE